MPDTATDALVLFGATGDLARKKIFPSIYRMHRRGVLGIPVVGVASSELTDEDLRGRAREAIEAHGDFDPEVWKTLEPLISYTSGDYRDPAAFDKLADKLGGAKHPLFYLAIPPVLFDDVVDGLAKIGLNEG